MPFKLKNANPLFTVVVKSDSSHYEVKASDLASPIIAPPLSLDM